MEDSRNRLLGFFFIIIGAVLILDHYDFISFNIWDLWPLILVYIGAKAERDYFKGHASGRNLLTGTTLIVYGLYFLIDTFSIWSIDFNFWPVFILGPALGFLQMAHFGHSPKHNYRKGFIMLVIAIVFFVNGFVNVQYELILFVGLIIIGLFMLRKPESITYEDEDENHDDDDSNSKKSERY